MGYLSPGLQISIRGEGRLWYRSPGLQISIRDGPSHTLILICKPVEQYPHPPSPLIRICKPGEQYPYRHPPLILISKPGERYRGKEWGTSLLVYT
jgi:hypothetical protein